MKPQLEDVEYMGGGGPSPGVDFANVLQAAFRRNDPKSKKGHLQFDCLFALLGSTGIKAVRKHVGEMDTMTG
jgi:hypothetical protein